MSDPKPLTRKELSEFLPSLRAVRAFEQLFDVVPGEINAQSDINEVLLTSAHSNSSASNRLEVRVSALEVALEALQITRKKVNLNDIERRLSQLEEALCLDKKMNLDSVEKRLTFLEEWGV